MSSRGWLVLLLVVACVKSPEAVAPVPAMPPPREGPTPPQLRLGTNVMPTEQRVVLTVDPKQPTFSGETEIDVRLAAPTRTVWLHAVGLTISKAEASVAGQTHRAEPVMVLDGPRVASLLELDFAAPLPAGAATLKLTFVGKVNHDGTEGLFHVKDGALEFAVTQFEPTRARMVMPCFDEPSFKIPWQLTLRGPADAMLVSNTPPEHESKDGALQVVRFKKTAPLPSYLVAFGVGPLVAVDVGTAGARKTPLRMLVPAGREKEVAFASKSMGRALEALETYFGTPYPYEKLDLLTVPTRFGAMENPGLITIASSLSVATAQEETDEFRRDSLSTIVHEIAHQWFGDLVTTAWWDDIWLNEAFAEWMTGRIVVQLEPSWNYDADTRRWVNEVVQEDAMLSARQIRQPISTVDDIENAFDGITYVKGQAVIGMFESWLGSEVFRKGVQRHLAAHRDGTAVANDFLDALTAEAQADVRGAFSSFLDQPGVPRVTATPSCREGRQWLQVKHERLLPLGSRGAPKPSHWAFPLCARWGAAKGEAQRRCVLITAAEQEVELGAGCGWVMPNAAATGYYRLEWTVEQARPLLAANSPLSRSERLAVLDDLSTQMSTGTLSIPAVFELVPELAKSKDTLLVAAAARWVSQVPDEFITDATRPRLAAFVRRHFGARARALGFAAGAKDDAETRKLREVLVPIVTEVGEEPQLTKAGLAVVTKSLEQPGSVEGDTESLAMDSVAAVLPAKQVEQALKQVQGERSAVRQQALMSLLRGTRDPALAVKVASLVLAEGADTAQMGNLVNGTSFTAHARLEQVRSHVDAYLAALPETSKPWLPMMLTACDATQRAELDAFWAPRASTVSGGPRMFAQALEGMDLCLAWKKARAEELNAWLAKQPLR